MDGNVPWVTVMLAFIVSLPATIAACVAAYLAIKNNQQSIENAKKIEEVHIATNSMKDALVKATRDTALAEGAATGRIEGKRDEKAEANVRKLAKIENDAAGGKSSGGGVVTTKGEEVSGVVEVEEDKK